MSIQYMNIQVLQQALTGAWQKELGTSQDPANGQWYTNGANDDGVGLYGGLTDALPSAPNFNTSSQTYIPEQIVCAASTVNNLNGLIPSSEVTLTYSYSNTTSYSQTVTSGINSSISETVGVNSKFVTESTDFDVSYNWSIAQTSGTQTSETFTFSQTLTINVPTGKVYQAVLTASKQTLQVPYSAAITVTGTTETWFESQVNGHYNWMASAGEAFSWVNQFSTAGSDSTYFGSNGSTGLYTEYGTLTCIQTVDFFVQVYDVTSQYQADPAQFEQSVPGSVPSNSPLVSSSPYGTPSS